MQSDAAPGGAAVMLRAGHNPGQKGAKNEGFDD